MEEIRRQLQETRGRLKEMGMGFEPKEADTMAAARSDDEEASITTNDVAAAGNANATETIRVQRGVVEDGGSKARRTNVKCARGGREGVGRGAELRRE